MGSKHKKVILEDKEKQQPSKKNKIKQPVRYHRNAGVKMEALTSVRDVCTPDRIAWCTIQSE